MILSFGDRATEDLYHGEPSHRVLRFPADVVRTAQRKMDLLHAAATLGDLKSPPGHRLEVMKGEWKGFHSIRVNKQWRLIFRWQAGNVTEVRFLDYHD